MVKVKQTSLVKGEGDCLSACVASILELPIESVPNFCSDGLDVDGSNWLIRLGNWLASVGCGFIHYRWAESFSVLPFNCFGIAMGPTDRSEERHAVVVSVKVGTPTVSAEESLIKTEWCLIDEWDPHPSSAFLSGVDEVLFLVPCSYCAGR